MTRTQKGILIAVLGVPVLLFGMGWYTHQQQHPAQHDISPESNATGQAIGHAADGVRYITRTPFVTRVEPGHRLAWMSSLSAISYAPTKELDIGAYKGQWVVMMLAAYGMPYGIAGSGIGPTTDRGSIQGKTSDIASMARYIRTLRQHLGDLPHRFVLAQMNPSYIDPLHIPGSRWRQKEIDKVADFAYIDYQKDLAAEIMKVAAWVDVAVLNAGQPGLAGKIFVGQERDSVFPLTLIIDPQGRLAGYIHGFDSTGKSLAGAESVAREIRAHINLPAVHDPAGSATWLDRLANGFAPKKQEQTLPPYRSIARLRNLPPSPRSQFVAALRGFAALPTQAFDAAYLKEYYAYSAREEQFRAMMAPKSEADHDARD